MMKSFPPYGIAYRPALACLILLVTLSGCGMMSKRSQSTAPPRVACEERAPAEEAVPIPPLPATGAALPEWIAAAMNMRRAALGWAGVATAEVEKRVTTAECLDRLREQGVIQ